MTLHIYKKGIRRSLIGIVLVALCAVPAGFVVAANDAFVPLAPIPGYSGGGDLGSFLNAAFRLGLAVAGTLAVVMITIGGLEYMTTDSITGKTGGRERITNAILGLLIALLIWVVLYTINPNLLRFDFISKINRPPGANTSGLPSGSFNSGSGSKGGGQLSRDNASQQLQGKTVQQQYGGNVQGVSIPPQGTQEDFRDFTDRCITAGGNPTITSGLGQTPRGECVGP